MLAMLVAAPLLACEARNLVADAGGAGGTGVIVDRWPTVLLSDFEDPAAATVVRVGSPPRNGTWNAYNDESATCVQTPAAGAPYVGEPPPAGTSPFSRGSLALHGRWAGCTSWGGGIGADINTPVVADGATYFGPKVPYDLSTYSGVTFYAMAAPGSDTHLRFKLTMRATTPVQGGGACDDTVNVCGDDWGLQFDLPGNGTWKQYIVRFSGVAFGQEGWGAVFPWNPSDVTGVQIQSVDVGEPYDFWIDMSLVP